MNVIYCIYRIYTISTIDTLYIIIPIKSGCSAAVAVSRQTAREKDGSMNIIITNSAGVPIYEQIASQIKGMIISGKLKEGEALPSMRVLAQDLRVSVITTKRAYEILEAEGLIQSFTGRGSFVAAQNPELLKEQNLREIEAHLTAAVEIAKQSGVELKELTDILSIIYCG